MEVIPLGHCYMPWCANGGDSLGPLLYALVLHKLAMKLDVEFGADLLLNVWVP